MARALGAVGSRSDDRLAGGLQRKVALINLFRNTVSVAAAGRSSLTAIAHLLQLSDCARVAGESPFRLKTLSHSVPPATVNLVANHPRMVRLIKWHSLYRGLADRVAKQLGLDPSYVNRIARGERRAANVEQALQAEVTRLEKLRPK